MLHISYYYAWVCYNACRIKKRNRYRKKNPVSGAFEVISVAIINYNLAVTYSIGYNAY